MRARREPEFILVRADRCPPGLVEELRAAHLPVQTLTRTFPGRPAELWYRLPAEVARGLLGAAGSA
jgi:hypothetical protein